MCDYYKIICEKEAEMAGQGLGYEAIFGHEDRYFARKTDADNRCRELNNWTDGDPLNGTYSVVQRQPGDDNGDSYFVRQMPALAASV